MAVKSKFYQQVFGRYALSILCITSLLAFMLYRGADYVRFIKFDLGLTQQQSVAQQCAASGDEALTQARDLPLVGDDYQARLASLPAMGTNIVANSALAVSQPTNSALPVGFSYELIAPEDRYEFVRNDTEGSYLRVSSSRATSAGEPGRAWEFTQQPVLDKQTYAIGFDYRADVTSTLTLETIKGAERTYTALAQLLPTKTWQRFSYYFSNDTYHADFVRFNISIKQAGQLDTKNYDLHRLLDARLPKGMVSVSFDDGWRSVLTEGLPLLQQYGIRSTHYVIANYAAQQKPQYATLGDLAIMKQAGQEIAAHSLDHCDIATLSADDIRLNAEEAKNILDAAELGPITSFAYPYGSYTKLTQAFFTANYSFVRSSDEGYNDKYFDQGNIRSIAITSSTTIDQFKKWLAYAAEHRVWLVLSYHQVGLASDYGVTVENFRQQLEAITQSGLEIAPVSETGQKILNL